MQGLGLEHLFKRIQSNPQHCQLTAGALRCPDEEGMDQ